jgi:heat shock protein 1/8
MVKGKAIGIDLGTSYASISVMENGKIEMIKDENGQTRMPCIVTFTDSGRLFFDEAKEHKKSVNTVFDINRLIGREVDDMEVKNCLRYCPFKVVDEMHRLKIEVNYENEMKRFYPEEIIAMLLNKLKEIAEKYLKSEIPNAVITVPACFNYGQRMATFDAAKIAGFNVLRLMNEPTAAAFTYDFARESSEAEHNVVVFDIGGCTLDVSVFIFEEKILNVKATAGDPNLGGDDFDSRLIDHCLREINLTHKINLSRNKRAIWLLKDACENAKRELSSTERVTIHIDCLYEGLNYHTVITRAVFEEINEDLFFRIRKVLERVMFDSRLTVEQIHEVILVGGSTRIPRIQILVNEFFGKEPNRSLNPDEAVASGAAILASMLIGDKSESIKDLLVLEITPYTYGIEKNGGFMAPIVPRNTTIPIIHKQVFTSYLNPLKDYKMLKEYHLASGQPGVLIDIFEGESRYARENAFLGSIELPIESDFEAVVEIEMDIDVNGVLIVNAYDRSSGNTSQLKVNKGHLSQLEMFRLMRDAEKYKHDDEIEHERIAFKNSFEAFCFEMKTVVQESAGMSEEEKRAHLNFCESEVKWAEDNEKASAQEIEKEFRKCAGIASSLLTPQLLNLYKNAYAVLGDTKFLFDEANIMALREKQQQKVRETRHHHHHHHHKNEKKEVEK